MSSILKVALAGATGNLGPAILDELLQAGFKVTVLTRINSTSNLPSSATIATVDYDSLESLTMALQGQDAVVSTISSAGIAAQLRLVEAASKAHVKRFIPSEFGSDTSHEKTRTLPVFRDKIVVQEALKKEASLGTLSYTLVCTGPFFDWGLKIPFIVNLKGKSIDLFDGGDRLFSTSTLSTIGKAVVGVLKNPEPTKNRAVYVQDKALTLRDLAAVAKKATGSDGWKENVVRIDDCLEHGWTELKKEKPDPHVFALDFVKASIWGDGYGSHFQTLDNELLGIKEKSDEEVQDMVNRLTK